MVDNIDIEIFLSLSRQFPVVDVRSPGEYDHAHIPGAFNVPLFTDEQRKVVGTIYKQEGREQAIKAGLGYFGVKMNKMIEDVEALSNNHHGEKCVLVHCWRGGMRSAGVAWLLGLYGFKVYILSGGYKAFRNWALRQFEKQYALEVVGGYTGSGKTEVLKELKRNGQKVVDLEGIAKHKGSAFGGIGENPQPSQEQFENELAMQLHAMSSTSPSQIWVEDESRRIGLVNIPASFWEKMQQSVVHFLKVPFEARLEHITATYGKYKKQELKNAILRIQKRLGGVNTKNALTCLTEDDYKECFRILLSYYDKLYDKAAQSRQMSVHIECERVDANANANKLTTQKNIA